MKSCMALAIVIIWVLALLLAAPLLVFSITHVVEPVNGLRLYEICFEDPQMTVIKATYSVASVLLQYLAPIIIVSVAHAQICNKLRARMSTGQQSARPTTSTVVATGGTSQMECTTQTTSAVLQVVVDAPSNSRTSVFAERRRRKDALRKRKTNRLLFAIAVVFACSWLPLNVCNILADFYHNGNSLTFAICHLIALGSACANPVLYGWLNDNFRREFVAVLCRRCGGATRVTLRSAASRADVDRDVIDCTESRPCHVTDDRVRRALCAEVDSSTPQQVPRHHHNHRVSMCIDQGDGHNVGTTTVVLLQDLHCASDSQPRVAPTNLLSRVL